MHGMQFIEYNSYNITYAIQSIQLNAENNIHKGCCKKNWCFEFYNFGLNFLKQNERCPFLFLRF